MKKVLFIVLTFFILVGCEKELPRLATPENVVVEGNTIKFDKVDKATHYIVSVNGSQISITDTKYELTQPGVYSIKVKAQAKGYKESLYSVKVTHVIQGINPNLKFTYSLKSTSDLTIYEVTLDNPTIRLGDVDSEHIVYASEMIQVKGDYLRTLNVGTHEFLLSINEVPYDIEIKIIDSNDPYLMINSNYYFNSTLDIVVRFDNFGSSISVSGSSLLKSDYFVKDNKVTVKREFIADYFEEHPEYNMYVLTINFQKDNKTQLARVWIHKN